MSNDSELGEVIRAKARLVIRGYPTQGVSLDDLVSITQELCEDDNRHPSYRTVKSIIKAAKFYHRGRRYYKGEKCQNRA